MQAPKVSCSLLAGLFKLRLQKRAGKPVLYGYTGVYPGLQCCQSCRM